MKLGYEIVYRCTFNQGKQVDIIVERKNKKKNTTYTFVLAVLRPDNHLYVEYNFLDLFEQLCEKECECTFDSEKYARILVKDYKED